MVVQASGGILAASSRRRVTKDPHRTSMDQDLSVDVASVVLRWPLVEASAWKCQAKTKKLRELCCYHRRHRYHPSLP